MSGLQGMDISSRGMCQAGPLHCHSILQLNLRRVVRSPMRRHVRAAVEEQDRGKHCWLVHDSATCPAVIDHAPHLYNASQAVRQHQSPSL